MGVPLGDVTQYYQEKYGSRISKSTQQAVPLAHHLVAEARKAKKITKAKNETNNLKSERPVRKPSSLKKKVSKPAPPRSKYNLRKKVKKRKVPKSNDVPPPVQSKKRKLNGPGEIQTRLERPRKQQSIGKTLILERLQRTNVNSDLWRQITRILEPEITVQILVPWPLAWLLVQGSVGGVLDFFPIPFKRARVHVCLDLYDECWQHNVCEYQLSGEELSKIPRCPRRREKGYQLVVGEITVDESRKVSSQQDLEQTVQIHRRCDSFRSILGAGQNSVFRDFYLWKCSDPEEYESPYTKTRSCPEVSPVVRYRGLYELKYTDH